MKLAITLKTHSNLSVYRQLAEALLEAILNGDLKAGDMLPSTRDLAQQLKISRPTVLRSYELLVSQGYLDTISGAGTFVGKNQPGRLTKPVAPDNTTQFSLQNTNAAELPPIAKAALSDYGRYFGDNSTVEAIEAEVVSELIYGLPPLNSVPLKQWQRKMIKHCRTDTNPLSAHNDDPFGSRALREAITNYLARTRAINCDPDQVAIFAGFQQGLDLIGRIFLDPGDSVAVENPGYRGARRTLLSLGANLIPIPVDDEGIVVSHLNNVAEKIKLVYVVPSHHDPTGAVLSLSRRLELLAWAKRAGALIVEDDCDSEYRYGGRALPALQGLDENGSVIYAMNLKKVLFPVEWLTFYILPKQLLPIIKCAKSMVARELPLLQQAVLADLINEGFVERHIRKTQTIYAGRQSALVNALITHFGSTVILAKESGGMHIMVRFDLDLPSDRISQLASECGLTLISTAPYYMTEPVAGEFLMPFAKLDHSAIAVAIRQFALLVLHPTHCS